MGGRSPGRWLTGAVPEGDSIYKLARRLDRRLRGQRVLRTDLRVPRLATRDLTGRTLLEHATYGKHLLTRFDAGPLDGVDPEPVTLHSHLLMDGEWSVTGPGKRLPTRLMNEVRVVLETAGGTGWGRRLHQLDLVRTRDEDRLVGHLGPDPLRPDWDAAEAVRRLAGDPDRPLVTALLDQTRMAGLGNLWANELAYLTGVSPWTPVGRVDLVRLVDRAALALRHSATVDGAYQVTTGLGTRGDTHWVSGRQRRPCLRCGTEVQMVAELVNDPGNRRTWWCPHCQPGPGPEVRRRSTGSW